MAEAPAPEPGEQRAVEQDPAELAERAESEPLPEERRYTELFGLPAMMLLIAAVAIIKGLITAEAGFTIVGIVVAVGILLAIGFSMTIAKRE